LGSIRHSTRAQQCSYFIAHHNPPWRKAEVIEAEEELKALQRHALAIVDPEVQQS
jgi:hypothetical protein